MKRTMMKWLFPSPLLFAGALSVTAQGTVTFNTFNGASTALGQVFWYDNVPPGPAFVGQLWWSDTSDGAFSPFDNSGGPQPFSDTVPTYIMDGSVGQSSRVAGTTVWIELRVWNSAAGGTWDAAINSPLLTGAGVSGRKTRVLAGVDSDGNIFTPQHFNNFANFTLGIPEPATAAIGGLGFALLLASFRRSK